MFSLDAIVDVRRRRHEMTFFNISEFTIVCNFNIHQNVALDSLYILTGNDVTSYFRLAAHRISVSILTPKSILVMFGSRFLV